MQITHLATTYVQALQPYQPGKPIAELAREYGLQDIIKLASNENPLGFSPMVKQVLADNLCDLHRYPDGNGFELKQALAQKHQIDMQCITLGNGSNDVLELIARAFITPQQAVMYAQYAFAVYPLATQAVGGLHNVIAANNYAHDLTAMLAGLTPATRLIFIANPNNPTGTWLNQHDLYQFLTQVPKDVLVVIDEAYIEYVTAVDYPDASLWLAEFPNLIVTRTFSKAYGLAGLRVGYALSQPQIADILNRVRQPFNVNQMALLAAQTALQDQTHIQNSIAANTAGMQQLCLGFKQLALEYIPSQANFITVKVKNASMVYENLLRQGIIVRPLAGYQLPQHLRITIGSTAENARLLQALNNISA
jgi:histidinol-phosphate aminotransferase